MNKKELQELIRLEVQNVVKLELRKMVKPLVQEAVAGALANLIAEGIVKGAPDNSSKILRPNVPQVKINKPEPRRAQAKTNLDETARRKLAAKMGYSQIDRIGSQSSSTGDMVTDILAETAAQMEEDGGYNVPSVLDNVEEISSVVLPDAVEAITKDYSALMQRMKQRGMLNG